MTFGLRMRLLSSALAAVLLVGFGGFALSAAPTQSAWTDNVHASAAVTSGEWSAPVTIGCVAMNAKGNPKRNGTCTVTSITYEGWGNSTTRNRNYYITISSNAGQNGFVELTVDLRTATKTNDSAPGTWRWASSATLGGNLDVTSACSSLPILTAETPAGWGANGTYYLPLTDNKSAASSGSISCS